MESEKLTPAFAKIALGDDFLPDCDYFLHTTEAGFIIDRYNPATKKRDTFTIKEDPEDNSYDLEHDYPQEVVDLPPVADLSFLQRAFWRLMLYPWQIVAVLTALALTVVIVILNKAGAI